MDDVGWRRTAEVVLGALYLRGLQRSNEAPRKSWPGVLDALRSQPPDLGQAWALLRERGLWFEAAMLQEAGLVDAAEKLLAKGKLLTAASESYPARWLRVLGGSAPPALWLRGQLPLAPYLTIVGSRHIDRTTACFADGCGANAVRLGYSVASGAASGCDRAAAAGARPEHVLEILPYGMQAGAATPRACHLSLQAPDEGFSTPSAMERNTLLYAISDAAIVVQARFKQGGTWTGATAAIRRRLCQVIVWDRQDEACSALISLGAVPLHTPETLGDAVSAAEHRPCQLGLGIGVG